MRTDKLIKLLADDLKPVQRKRPVRQALLYVIGVLLFISALVAGLSGFFSGAHIPYYSFEIFLVLTIFITSVFAAFRASIPGSDRKVLYLPVILFALWGGTLFYRFFSAGAVIQAHGHTGCVADILLFSVLPLLLLLKLIRGNAPVHGPMTFFIIMIGVLSLAAGATQYLCPDESAFHLLSEHWLSVLLASLAGILLGRKVLRW